MYVIAALREGFERAGKGGETRAIQTPAQEREWRASRESEGVSKWPDGPQGDRFVLRALRKAEVTGVRGAKGGVIESSWSKYHQSRRRPGRAPCPASKVWASRATVDPPENQGEDAYGRTARKMRWGQIA